MDGFLLSLCVCVCVCAADCAFIMLGFFWLLV